MHEIRVTLAKTLLRFDCCQWLYTFFFNSRNVNSWYFNAIVYSNNYKQHIALDLSSILQYTFVDREFNYVLLIFAPADLECLQIRTTPQSTCQN